ncbi:hypothetical protein KAR91_54010 [Candidatus Pacearchaeota archaeon]|nr:hypothetical protein [Candidatus Pacearchaeota archaeon]
MVEIRRCFQVLDDKRCNGRVIPDDTGDLVCTIYGLIYDDSEFKDAPGEVDNG